MPELFHNASEPPPGTLLRLSSLLPGAGCSVPPRRADDPAVALRATSRVCWMAEPMTPSIGRPPASLALRASSPEDRREGPPGHHGAFPLASPRGSVPRGLLVELGRTLTLRLGDDEQASAMEEALFCGNGPGEPWGRSTSLYRLRRFTTSHAHRIQRPRPDPLWQGVREAMDPIMCGGRLVLAHGAHTCGPQARLSDLEIAGAPDPAAARSIDLRLAGSARLVYAPSRATGSCEASYVGCRPEKLRRMLTEPTRASIVAISV